MSGNEIRRRYEDARVAMHPGGIRMVIFSTFELLVLVL